MRLCKNTFCDSLILLEFCLLAVVCFIIAVLLLVLGLIHILILILFVLTFHENSPRFQAYYRLKRGYLYGNPENFRGVLCRRAQNSFGRHAAQFGNFLCGQENPVRPVTFSPVRHRCQIGRVGFQKQAVFGQ